MIVLYRVYNSSISLKYQYQLTTTPIQMIRLMIIHFLVHIYSNTLQRSSETEIHVFKKKSDSTFLNMKDGIVMDLIRNSSVKNNQANGEGGFF